MSFFEQIKILWDENEKTLNGYFDMDFNGKIYTGCLDIIANSCLEITSLTILTNKNRKKMLL